MIRQFPHIQFLKAAVLSGCFFVCGCHNDYQEVQDLAKKKTPVDKVTNVESYLSQNGAVRAKLTAPLMTIVRNDTPKTEFPKTLHVDFYDSTVNIQSKLFAKYGLYYNNKHLIFWLFTGKHHKRHHRRRNGRIRSPNDQTNGKKTENRQKTQKIRNLAFQPLKFLIISIKNPCLAKIEM